MRQGSDFMFNLEIVDEVHVHTVEKDYAVMNPYQIVGIIVAPDVERVATIV